LIFQLSYVSQVWERDEISTAHSSHTHHQPKTKHCSHQGTIVCAAAVDILTRVSGVRQCRGASSSLQEQGAATDGAEAPSFVPAQSTSSREQVTTDDADRGSSPSLPANNFFSGGRPNFSMHQNPQKNRQMLNKERPIFDTMRIAPPHRRNFTIDLQRRWSINR